MLPWEEQKKSEPELSLVQGDPGGNVPTVAQPVRKGVVRETPSGEKRPDLTHGSSGSPND